jgi:hypothetical protein
MVVFLRLVMAAGLGRHGMGTTMEGTTGRLDKWMYGNNNITS